MRDLRPELAQRLDRWPHLFGVEAASCSHTMPNRRHAVVLNLTCEVRTCVNVFDIAETEQPHQLREALLMLGAMAALRGVTPGELAERHCLAAAEAIEVAALVKGLWYVLPSTLAWDCLVDIAGAVNAAREAEKVRA